MHVFFSAQEIKFFDFKFGICNSKTAIPIEILKKTHTKQCGHVNKLLLKLYEMDFYLQSFRAIFT